MQLYIPSNVILPATIKCISPKHKLMRKAVYNYISYDAISSFPFSLKCYKLTDKIPEVAKNKVSTLVNLVIKKDH